MGAYHDAESISGKIRLRLPKKRQSRGSTRAGNGDPDENGIVLDPLRENRRLTPVERLEKMERFAVTVRLLKNAKDVRVAPLLR